MIIVRLIGGLGNQMFQYAAGRRLAEKHSTILKLDVTGFEEYKLHRYSLHCFHVWEHLATKSEIEEIQEIRESIIKKKFINKILDYDIEVIKDPKRITEVSKIMSLLLIFIVKRKK